MDFDAAAIIETEAQARTWLVEKLGVSRETLVTLERFELLLQAEAAQQNLIAPSTIDQIWSRHFVDSAQLLIHARHPNGDRDLPWLDLGSGAGFPGLIVALLSDWEVVLVESRARRVEYLKRVVAALGIANVRIIGRRLERIEPFPVSVISARAFAPLPKLLSLSQAFSTEKTLWLLPKGRNAVNELEMLGREWHHAFHVEQSLTEAGAGIVAGQLLRKNRRK